MADVIVIGAGLSGLAAAHRLQKNGVDVQVIERAPVAGGHMRTIQRDGWRYERGPNSFLGSAEALRKLAEDVGLTPVAARPAASKRYLFLDGVLQSAPASPIEAIRTDLLPTSAKLRLLAEPLTGARPQETDSVREFFEHRLGKEFTDRLVDAFVSGIYAGNISEMSMAAAFPKVFDAAVEHGSLMRAAVAMMRAPRGKPAVRGTFSFPGGLGDLPTELGAHLENRLHLGVDTPLTLTGGRWSAAGITAPIVLLATPSWAAAPIVAKTSPELAARLSEIPYSPVAGVHLLFRRDTIEHPLDGFGFLAPKREGLRILGCIWSSALFDVCTPYGTALTCMVGGAHHPQTVSLSDEELVKGVQSDLARTMNIMSDPVDFAIVRHSHAIAQFGRNHVRLRSEIRRLASEVPGLILGGSYLDGVSMNDAVVGGEAAADEALKRLAPERAEQAA